LYQPNRSCDFFLFFGPIKFTPTQLVSFFPSRMAPLLQQILSRCHASVTGGARLEAAAFRSTTLLPVGIVTHSSHCPAFFTCVQTLGTDADARIQVSAGRCLSEQIIIIRNRMVGRSSCKRSGATIKLGYSNGGECVGSFVTNK
jgi:hypothetical protein